MLGYTKMDAVRLQASCYEALTYITSERKRIDDEQRKQERAETERYYAEIDELWRRSKRFLFCFGFMFPVYLVRYACISQPKHFSYDTFYMSELDFFELDWFDIEKDICKVYNGLVKNTSKEVTISLSFLAKLAKVPMEQQV